MEQFDSSVSASSASWWSGVMVSALASINEVNQRRARLVLRWVTVSISEHFRDKELIIRRYIKSPSFLLFTGDVILKPLTLCSLQKSVS